MTAFKRMLYVILTLALLMAPAARAQERVSDIVLSQMRDDGIVRVYLKSLDNPQALYLTFAGEYTLDGPTPMRFERDAKVALAAYNGSILLSSSGLTLDIGSDVTFTRCAAADGLENGLYIYESRRNALFEGDLRLTCEGDGLRPILSIGIEDYLCGVVAYEMSDAFPLEALKAQAVAARTYAMERKASRVGADYDVTDTTSDQVFNGLISEYANVLRAVRETHGVVGTYKGKFASCYYTASNGGQIATPNQIWGGNGDYGYIQQKDDPYDLENSLSLTNTFAVSRQRDEANTLWQMLDAKLDKGDHEEVRADAILTMDLTDPAHEGSRMYRALGVTVSLSARDNGLVPVDFDGEAVEGWALGYAQLDGQWCAWGLQDWRALDEPVTILFSIYDEIKDGLGLGLNGGDYEIPSIAESENAFEIRFRRFGHGSGMSQRGAQTMAGSHGMDYIQILNFYYPGMTLEKIGWDSPELLPMEALPAALVRERLLIPPLAVDLEPLDAGEYFAVVTLESARSRLNVRAEPSTEAGIVVKLDHGYRVVVCEDAGDGWVRIRGGIFTGYVKAEYLSAE